MYSSRNTIRRMKLRKMKWTGHVAHKGEKKNVYMIVMAKPEGKRTKGRIRRRWEDNIKMDVREMGWGSMDWIDLPLDRDQWRALLNTVMNLRIP
jgi:hypothetical protein